MAKKRGDRKAVERETGQPFADVVLERLNSSKTVGDAMESLGFTRARFYQLAEEYGFTRRCVWVRVVPTADAESKETAS